jgi:16S rRNA (uracil1498-N3)-methyltransferase
MVTSSKQARWETIVREAAEQCGRGRLPTVEPICSFSEALANATGVRLLPWEEAERSSGLVHSLTHAPQPVESVSLLVGPEGGLEASEVEQAREAGWQVVTLGKRILRAETAALAALSVIISAVGALGDKPLLKPPAITKQSNPKRRGTKTRSEPSSDQQAQTDRGSRRLTRKQASQ